MAIRFKINEDGDRVAVVDTVRGFEKAINTLDCPIIAPAGQLQSPAVRQRISLDTPDRPFAQSAAFRDPCQATPRVERDHMKSDLSHRGAARRWALLSILFLGAGLLLSACGDGGASPPTTPPAAPPPAPTPPAPPPPPEPPPTPEDIGITSFAHDFIEWSWSPAAGASGYEVQVRANEAATDDDETIGRTADETSYRSEGLESGTLYYFRVRSLAGSGEDRLVSDWSAPATAQIGRIEQPVSLTLPEVSDEDLSGLPREAAAKLEAFFDYVNMAALSSRGLPDVEAGPITFGCRTPELLESLLLDLLEGSAEFAFAVVDLLFSLVFAEDLGDLDAKIAAAQSTWDGVLDRLAANLREDRCGFLHLNDPFVWQGEEDVIPSLTLELPDGTTEQLPELRVIRILGTGTTLDSAPSSAEPTLWWIPVDDSWPGGETGFSVFSSAPFPLPRDHRENPY